MNAYLPFTWKPQLKSTFHEDGTVSFWSVSGRCWRRFPVDAMSREEISSLPLEERERCLRMRSKPLFA